MKQIKQVLLLKSRDRFPAGLGQCKKKTTTTFSEYGHVAYPIKGNEAYNDKLVNMLPLHTPLTPGWGQKGHFFLL